MNSNTNGGQQHVKKHIKTPHGGDDHRRQTKGVEDLAIVRRTNARCCRRMSQRDGAETRADFAASDMPCQSPSRKNHRTDGAVANTELKGKSGWVNITEEEVGS
jgi:hypothetical protein